MGQTHKTVTLHIPEPVEVDEQIVPLVLWLNSLDGVKTTNSCQGDPFGVWHKCEDDSGCSYSSTPYVSFTCKNEESLRTVLGLVSDYNRIQPTEEDDLELWPYVDTKVFLQVEGCVGYGLYFEQSNECLRDFLVFFKERTNYDNHNDSNTVRQVRGQCDAAA